jgi:hypothetical protein
VLSCLSIRIEKETIRLERWADYLFLVGMVSLFIAILACYHRAILADNPSCAPCN